MVMDTEKQRRAERGCEARWRRAVARCALLLSYINISCTCPIFHSFSAEHKKRYFKKLAYLGVEKAQRLGYRIRWFVLTESDTCIEAGKHFGHEWKNLQAWIRSKYGEEIQFIWVEHLQGDKRRFNRHIIQYGINRLNVDEIEKYWQSHFLSKLTGLEEIEVVPEIWTGS